MFDRVGVGDLIYLGSHPWNTGDVFGHCVIVEKGEWDMLVQAIDVRSASGSTTSPRGLYNVSAHDLRKIIRLA
jgi:hypothetical protein